MEQHEVFTYTIDAVESLGLTYMVVGSVASIAFGEPRLTLDMDIVLDIRHEHISAFCARFPSPEFYVSSQAMREAIIHRTQFNVIHPDSGNKVDFMLPKGDSWARMQLAQRRTKEILNGRSAYTARPEDVIISKMLYYREGQSDKHLRDIAGMPRLCLNSQWPHDGPERARMRGDATKQCLTPRRGAATTQTGSFRPTRRAAWNRLICGGAPAQRVHRPSFRRCFLHLRRFQAVVGPLAIQTEPGVSHDIIDRDYIGKWAKELDVLDIWQAILQRVGMA